jgi:hypothetical protein
MHILKPSTSGCDGNAENEHLSLLLARAAGLIVPNSSVQHFGDEIAIVVERYDGMRTGGRESERPLREKLLEGARRREIDAVPVWRLHRLGRSVSDLLATLQNRLPHQISNQLQMR